VHPRLLPVVGITSPNWWRPGCDLDGGAEAAEGITIGFSPVGSRIKVIPGGRL